jgi:hypothetical protein
MSRVHHAPVHPFQGDRKMEPRENPDSDQKQTPEEAPTEDAIDEALALTFPASDPIAVQPEKKNPDA